MACHTFRHPSPLTPRRRHDSAKSERLRRVVVRRDLRLLSLPRHVPPESFRPYQHFLIAPPYSVGSHLAHPSFRVFRGRHHHRHRRVQGALFLVLSPSQNLALKFGPVYIAIGRATKGRRVAFPACAWVECRAATPTYHAIDDAVVSCGYQRRSAASMVACSISTCSTFWTGSFPQLSPACINLSPSWIG